MAKKTIERRCGYDRRNQVNSQVEEIISFFIPEEDERRKNKERRQKA